VTEHGDNPLPSGASPEAALEMARQAMAGTLMERLGIEWLEIGTARVVARMPVEGNTQVYGHLHGGATAALCESVGSFGTAVVAGLEKRVVGIDISVHHLQAVRHGGITATGIPLRVGRSVAVWDMRVEDDRGRLVAVGRLSVAIREG
jgi:1,4-dihydroxy-2-naphthoyl-CoA hydrolase